MAARVELAQVISQLRRELSAAMREGEGEDLRFRARNPEASPCEGMFGAAVRVGDRIVGVIAQHHRSDGLGWLAAVCLDLALVELDLARRAELRTQLGLPDILPEVVPPSADERLTTVYQAQVRDIAPDRMLDRDAEFDKLVGSCAGEQPYAWWQSGSDACTNALVEQLATLVCESPAGPLMAGDAAGNHVATARRRGEPSAGGMGAGCCW